MFVRVSNGDIGFLLFIFSSFFFLANRYLQKYPQIKNIIQQRFSYVFVDEMQDMEAHQYDLLEKLFYDDGNSTSVFQRIGDKNQSIYSSVKSYCIWKDRQEVLSLTKSYRLRASNMCIEGLYTFLLF